MKLIKNFSGRNFIPCMLLMVSCLMLLAPSKSCVDTIIGTYQVGTRVDSTCLTPTLNFPCNKSFLVEVPSGYITMKISKAPVGYNLSFILPDESEKHVAFLNSDGFMEDNVTKEDNKPECQETCSSYISFKATVEEGLNGQEDFKASEVGDGCEVYYNCETHIMYHGTNLGR